MVHSLLVTLIFITVCNGQRRWAGTYPSPQTQKPSEEAKDENFKFSENKENTDEWSGYIERDTIQRPSLRPVGKEEGNDPPHTRYDAKRVIEVIAPNKNQRPDSVSTNTRFEHERRTERPPIRDYNVKVDIAMDSRELDVKEHSLEDRITRSTIIPRDFRNVQHPDIEQKIAAKDFVDRTVSRDKGDYNRRHPANSRDYDSRTDHVTKSNNERIKGQEYPNIEIPRQSRDKGDYNRRNNPTINSRDYDSRTDHSINDEKIKGQEYPNIEIPRESRNKDDYDRRNSPPNSRDYESRIDQSTKINDEKIKGQEYPNIGIPRESTDKGDYNIRNNQPNSRDYEGRIDQSTKINDERIKGQEYPNIGIPRESIDKGDYNIRNSQPNSRDYEGRTDHSIKINNERLKGQGYPNIESTDHNRYIPSNSRDYVRPLHSTETKGQQYPNTRNSNERITPSNSRDNMNMRDQSMYLKGEKGKFNGNERDDEEIRRNRDYAQNPPRDNSDRRGDNIGYEETLRENNRDIYTIQSSKRKEERQSESSTSYDYVSQRPLLKESSNSNEGSLDIIENPRRDGIGHERRQFNSREDRRASRIPVYTDYPAPKEETKISIENSRNQERSTIRPSLERPITEDEMKYDDKFLKNSDQMSQPRIISSSVPSFTTTDCEMIIRNIQSYPNPALSIERTNERKENNNRFKQTERPNIKTETVRNTQNDRKVSIPNANEERRPKVETFNDDKFVNPASNNRPNSNVGDRLDVTENRRNIERFNNERGDSIGRKLEHPIVDPKEITGYHRNVSYDIIVFPDDDDHDTDSRTIDDHANPKRIGSYNEEDGKTNNDRINHNPELSTRSYNRYQRSATNMPTRRNKLKTVEDELSHKPANARDNEKDFTDDVVILFGFQQNRDREKNPNDEVIEEEIELFPPKEVRIHSRKQPSTENVTRNSSITSKSFSTETTKNLNITETSTSSYRENNKRQNSTRRNRYYRGRYAG